MGSLVKIFILICGIIFFAAVLYLLVRRKISEKNSILWLTSALAILCLAAAPDMLDEIAKFIGIKYPPSLLFLLSTLILLFISLTQSMQISALNEQVKELTQKFAISRLKDNLNSKKPENGGEPSCPVQASQEGEKHGGN